MDIIEIGNIPTVDELRHLWEISEERRFPTRLGYDDKVTWDKIIKDDNYLLREREQTATKNGLSGIEEIIGNLDINVIHIGPGSEGIEIKPIVEELKLKEKKGVYAAIDIGKGMLKEAYERNKNYLSGIKDLWYHTDVETKGNLKLVSDDVRKKGVNKNLFAILGQGVLCSNSQTWKEAHRAMEEQDYLAVVIEGDDPNKRKEICDSYDLDSMKKLFDDIVTNAGYNPNKGRFEKVIFNEEKSTVQVFFKPTGEKEIICLESYKPKDENEFRNRLNDYGFNVKYIKFFEDIHTFAVLCKKRTTD